MDDDERLRLEYDRAVELLRGLTETRFRLLALVPTLAGSVVAFGSGGASGVALLAIGLLGLTATAGILVYELRNGQIKGEAAARVRRLEERLLAGGALVRPASRKLLGFVRVSHTLGVALVYGAALAGWCYLVAWGALHAGSVAHARELGLAIGAVAGVLVAIEVLRLEPEDEEPESASAAGSSSPAA